MIRDRPGRTAAVAGAPSGELKPRLFGVGPVEDHRVPDQPAELGAHPVGQGPGGGLLVLGLLQADLDQLVVEERRVECAEHGLAEPGLAHVDHRPKGVSLATKPFTLGAAKRRMGRGGFGHVQGYQGGARLALGQGRGERSRLACAPVVLRLVSLLWLVVLPGCVGTGIALDRGAPVHPAAPVALVAVSARPPTAEPLVLLEAPAEPEPEASPAVDPRRATIEAILESRAPRLSAAARSEVAGELARAESDRGISALLLLALIEQESHFRPRAVGPRGSVGLMQIRPFVAAAVAGRHQLAYAEARDLTDPLVNVRIGIAFLGELNDEFGDIELALAAYHIGPTRVRARLRRGWRPRGPYVRRVMVRYQALRFETGDPTTAIGG